MNVVNNGWRGQQGQLATWKLKRQASRGNCLAHLFSSVSLSPSLSQSLSLACKHALHSWHVHTVSEQTQHIRIQTSTHTNTHIERGSQLPFETFWCVNKHLRAFQPNKTNFQSSTNNAGPVVTLAFLFVRGTAQLICHHKSRPRDPAKISEPLQPSPLERDERGT